MTTLTTHRFARLDGILPREFRERTAALCLNEAGNPVAASYLTLVAAMTGLGAVAVDGFGPSRGTHWLHRDLLEMLSAVDGQHVLQLIDAERSSFAEDLAGLVERHPHTLAVLCLNDAPRARAAAAALAQIGWSLPLLVHYVGPGGLVVASARTPAAALAALDSFGSAVVEGPAERGEEELNILAANVLMNRAVMAYRAPPPPQQTEVALLAYVGLTDLDLGLGANAETPAELAALIGRVSRAPTGLGGLSGRRLKVVGAGALGNWFLLAVSQQAGAHIVGYDHDKAEESNLTRQPLLFGHVGEFKVAALAGEYQALAPHSTYEPVPTRVEEPADLDPLGPTDVVVALPDNDRARAVAYRAASDAGAIYVQAGSGVEGGQMSVHRRTDACLECVTGVRADALGSSDPSCSAAEPAIVVSNAILAALVSLELRRTLAGGEPHNLRFNARALGNVLEPAASSLWACPHAAARGEGEPVYAQVL